MSSTPEPNDNVAIKGQKIKELTNSNRKSIVLSIASLSKDGVVPRGVFGSVAKNFEVHRTTVKRLWDQYSDVAGNALNIPAKKFSRRGNRGCPRVYEATEEFLECVKALPISQRRTLRDLGSSFNIGKSTISKLVHDGALRKHSSAIKPMLTEENKLQRIEWCVDHIDQHTGRYSEMLDVIHVDEKWFNLTETTKQCYLAADEPVPHRTTRHKSHIPRVMFLAATARPRYDNEKGETWDGKVGIWECVDYVPAARASCNRPAGTIEPKPYSINHERYSQLILEKVLPAILVKCPAEMRARTIYIQQDNAPPHRAIFTESLPLIEKCQQLNLSIAIRNQPPNSPDLNILDLGLFRALQSKQFRRTPTNLTELIQQVKQTYDEFPEKSIDNVWYTLQTTMNSIVEADGGNDYELTHVYKDKLEKTGQLLRSIVPIALHPVYFDQQEQQEPMNDDNEMAMAVDPAAANNAGLL
jgi:hypothetical protein